MKQIVGWIMDSAQLSRMRTLGSKLKGRTKKKMTWIVFISKFKAKDITKMEMLMQTAMATRIVTVMTSTKIKACSM